MRRKRRKVSRLFPPSADRRQRTRDTTRRATAGRRLRLYLSLSSLRSLHTPPNTPQWRTSKYKTEFILNDDNTITTHGVHGRGADTRHQRLTCASSSSSTADLHGFTTPPAMVSSEDPRPPHLVLGPPCLAVKACVFLRLSSQIAAAAAICCALSLSRTDLEAFLLEASVAVWLWCVHTFSDFAKNGSYVAAGKHSQSARRQVQCLLLQCVLHTWWGNGQHGLEWLALQQGPAWWRFGAP